MSDKLSDLARSLLKYGGDVSKLLDGSTSEESVVHVESSGSILKLEDLVLNGDDDKVDKVKARFFSRNSNDYQFYWRLRINKLLLIAEHTENFNYIGDHIS